MPPPDLYPVLRPLLFLLPPERAHALTLALLRHNFFARLIGGVDTSAPARTTSAALPGLVLRNPFGLAAGADKNAVALAGWEAIGFGFVEIGTVTPRPQRGNAPPRLWRFPRRRALVNALGFPNDGADAVAVRLRDWREKHPRGTGMFIGVNCGKQKDTPLENAAGDYLRVIEKCLPYADFIVVNVSSPNTPGLRSLQSAESISPLVRDVVQACRVGGGPGEAGVPVWVKISPDLESGALLETGEAILQAGADAIVATNTSLDHSPLAGELRGRTLPGGLSGEPLFGLSLRCVEALHKKFGTMLPIVGCGGISGPEHVRTFFEAGATLVELYTALVYSGPGLLRKLARL